MGEEWEEDRVSIMMCFYLLLQREAFLFAVKVTCQRAHPLTPAVLLCVCACRVCEMWREDSGCELWRWCGHTADWQRQRSLCGHSSHLPSSVRRSSAVQSEICSKMCTMVTRSSPGFIVRRYLSAALFCFPSLRPLEALSNIPVSHVACGSQHSVALTKGTVKCTVWWVKWWTQPVFLSRHVALCPPAFSALDLMSQCTDLCGHHMLFSVEDVDQKWPRGQR